jgi:hypothetical protein
MIQNQKRERRDWTLLIFIIPIGIILIIIVGQIAVRLSPIWSVNADMNSNLEPDPNAAQPLAILQPILPQILTPMAWMGNYLTPGADNIYFPPFMTLEPTATPSPTEATPSITESVPTEVTATGTPVPTNTNVVTATTPAPTETEDPEETGTPPPATCTDPGADNFGGPLPCDYTSTTTCTDPGADNFGGPLPCDYTSTTTCTDPHANNNGGPLPCDYGAIATIDPGLTTATPPPELDVDAPPNNTDPYDDSNVGTIADGTYIVISLQITVDSTPDNNYDLAYYEWNNGGAVYLDWIIIGITNDPTGSTYYEVFNWGDGDPDLNSNVGDIAAAAGDEFDDHTVPVSDNAEVPVLPPEDELHDPDHDPGNPPADPETNGPLPGTGVLIDVDSAPSDPPPNTYEYIVIISPPGGTGGDAQVDAIQATEVPIPTP